MTTVITAALVVEVGEAKDIITTCASATMLAVLWFPKVSAR